MRTAFIGSLEVSVVGLGCNNFGRPLDQEGTGEVLDQEGSRQVVDSALDAGITYFDTAANYGEGRSESYLGRALGSRRGGVVIGTKVGVPVTGLPESGGASPGNVRRMAERSLRELGTDYIDLYQLHRPDPDTPIEETLGAMSQLVEEGMVREIGCSNLDAAQLAEALQASRSLQAPRFVSDQVEYSLLHRDPERDGLAALCREEGVSLLPYYPLASGMLTGKARRGRQLEGRLRMSRYERFLSDRNFEVAEEVCRFAEERGLLPVQVAIGWLLSRREVPSVTAGATRPEQVAANAKAAEWDPTPEDLALLDAITGG